MIWTGCPSLPLLTEEMCHNAIQIRKKWTLFKHQVIKVIVLLDAQHGCSLQIWEPSATMYKVYRSEASMWEGHMERLHRK